MANRPATAKKGKKIKAASAIVGVILAVCWLVLALGEQMGWNFPPMISDLAAIVTGGETTPILDGECRVHFIDVGQGDSMLIQADGQNALIDAGENGKGTVVADYLKGQGVEKIDLLLMTHPHSDHIGGMDDVIGAFDIGKIVLPRLPDEIVPTTKTYTDVLTAIQNKSLKMTPTKPGMTLPLGKGVFTLLGPVKDYEDLNNTSLVCRFDYGDVSFLFTGDAEADAERDLLDSGADVRANVLKLGHHGSRTSTGRAFYQAVDPEYCAIEVGDGNDYGHPHKNTLQTIAANGAEIYRTDFQGNIVFTITDGVLSVSE